MLDVGLRASASGKALWLPKICSDGFFLKSKREEPNLSNILGLQDLGLIGCRLP